MKREHRESGEQGCSSNKMCKEENHQGGGDMDELLAVLGYKVKSSDMADVAQKLEQLEMAMGSFQEDGISHLSCDTVHYNPSDLSGWIESMLSELNPSQTFDPNTSFSSIQTRATESPQHPSIITSASQRAIYEDNSEYDLGVIPRIAAYKSSGSDSSSAGVSNSTNTNKRVKREPTSSVNSTPTPEATRPMIVVDSQENGVRLVHTLMACAEAVQNNNLKLADALVKQIGILAVSQAGAMRKVATYFAEGLARRIYKICPRSSSVDLSFSDTLQMHFYETCPYLKFAHFTANQAILDAFAGATRVHVIDFSMKQGMQWPALMQALALRPGGPPVFRLTGIGPPQPDNTDALQQVGWKLARLAESLSVEFHYRGFVCDSLADLEPLMLDIPSNSSETVAVNSIFELHRMLARPGAMEKVLNTIKAVRPKIVTVVEQEANHNGPVFLDRFNEALHYYSTMFDSVEGSGLTPSTNEDLMMTELYLGRQICNVVACEGAERVERHETLTHWRTRMNAAGFEPAHLGSNAFKQASTLLALFTTGDGYRVEENNGCLMLGWHTRPLIAASAWRLA